MALSQVLTFNWARSGDTISQAVTVTTDAFDDRDIVVPASTTDMPVSLAVDVSALASCFLLSDVTVTLKTNSTSDPDDTLILQAGVPTVWLADSEAGCPFSTDIASQVFVTNATSDEATLKIRVAQDSTP